MRSLCLKLNFLMAKSVFAGYNFVHRVFRWSELVDQCGIGLEYHN